jgi:hypothetical protein
LQSPLPLTAEDIQAGLRSILKGSAPGASGLRHSHIDGMITAPSPQAAATALEALVSLVNKLASGRAPSSFATWLCGAPLTALAKAYGGVRPIAAGEVIRRLVAKCLMGRVNQSAQALLAPLQMGVAVQGGAVAIIHTTRRLVLDHAVQSSDPDWALLQVDFSNAFNLVS